MKHKRNCFCNECFNEECRIMEEEEEEEEEEEHGIANAKRQNTSLKKTEKTAEDDIVFDEVDGNIIL